MAQTTESAPSIDDMALEYTESFINGNRNYVCESIACLDNHSVSDATAIAARVALGLPPHLQYDFAHHLALRADSDEL